MAKTKTGIKTEGASARMDHQAGQPIINPYRPYSWQANAWSDGWRAMDSIVRLSEAQKVLDGEHETIQFDTVVHDMGMDTSFDWTAPVFAEYLDAWKEQNACSGKQAVTKKVAGDKATVHVATKDNLPRDVATGIAIPFPANMPEPTRQHIRCLETDMNFLAGNVDGSKLVRYAKKIEVLYARYQ
jgi:hypothetical protein